MVYIRLAPGRHDLPYKIVWLGDNLCCAFVRHLLVVDKNRHRGCQALSLVCFGRRGATRKERNELLSAAITTLAPAPGSVSHVCTGSGRITFLNGFTGIVATRFSR